MKFSCDPADTLGVRVRAVCVVTCVCALACVPGCSSIPSETGIRLGDETLKQFRAGVTTEAWLLAVAGPPSSQAMVEGVENTKVFRYVLGQRVTGLGAMMSGEATRTTAVVYFVITNGIVTRFWADRAVEHTITGEPVEASGGEKVGG